MVSDSRARELLYESEHNLSLSLSEIERFILWRILCYYNGVKMSDGDGRTARLGIDRPLGVAALDHLHPNGDRARAALDSLRDLGIIKDESRYICRTEVPYCPTRRGRQVMDEVLGPAFREMRADAELVTGNVDTESVLLGEQNEGLLHRYMIMQIHAAFDWDDRNLPLLCPTGNSQRPDVDIERMGRKQMYWEAWTGHHATEQVARKYLSWKDRRAEVHWLVPDAETGRRLLRIFLEQTQHRFQSNCDFTAEYSPSQLNDKLNQRHTPGIDKLWTLSTLRAEHIEPQYDAY